MPIYTYNCPKCGKFEEMFLTFKAAEEKEGKIKCPECGQKAQKEEFDMPARFAGTFGEDATAPSKRYTYKKSLKNQDPNKGSAS